MVKVVAQTGERSDGQGIVVVVVVVIVDASGVAENRRMRRR